MIQVEVRSDLEVAMNRWKKLLSMEGIHSQIERRLKYPNATDRKRAKDRQAARRREKAMKKRERYEAIGRQREGSHDRIFRRQDEANRIFDLRRALPADSVGGN